MDYIHSSKLLNTQRSPGYSVNFNLPGPESSLAREMYKGRVICTKKDKDDPEDEDYSKVTDITSRTMRDLQELYITGRWKKSLVRTSITSRRYIIDGGNSSNQSWIIMYSVMLNDSGLHFRHVEEVSA